MPIPIGAQLGSHEITDFLGKGGMGEVYRARDSRLKREVAIKILPDEFSQDAERVSRFQREAELLASLNHPNIAGIYSLEEANASRYLVLELVEGETLADRIARGPVPVAEAMKIARSICEAVEAAHEKGIVHRDLKPANVKITPDGTVKVLDFGLAKALEGASPQVTSNSPTLLSAAATNAGVILGTAPYMSPEQAKGHAADQRSDIFSFGCVLYEMLTGRQAFQADTVTESIAAVLMREADLQALPPNLNAKIPELLRRCLAKNRKERWHAIGDVRVEIEGIIREPHGTQVSRGSDSRPFWKKLVPIAVGVFLAAVATALVFTFTDRQEVTALRRMQFEVEHPATGPENQLAISLDGSQITTVVGPSDSSLLWLRALNHANDQLLKGTVAGQDPFFSPDGRFIGFVTAGKLKRIDIIGGPAQTLANAANMGGSWNADGVIIFNPKGEGPLHQIPAGGGTSVPVTELDKAREETVHLRPFFLPDGKRFLYLARSSNPENNAIFLGSLDGKKGKFLLSSMAAAVFAPPRHLLFIRDSALLAQEVNPSTFDFLGDPAPIAEDVANNTTNARVGFAASGNGILVYRSTVLGNFQLLSFDRSGSQSNVESASPHRNLKVSPDNRQIAWIRPMDNASREGGDIWLYDLARKAESRFTSSDGLKRNPVWSPDAKQIVFRSTQGGNVFNLYVKSAGGVEQEQLILKSDSNKTPTDWSNDGRYIVYHEQNLKTQNDIWLLPTSGDRKPTPFLQTEFNETNGRLSPDGKWMAYQSNETGRSEIYVQTVPPSGKKWKISDGDGGSPRWRADGKELFYSVPSGVVAVEVKAANAPNQFEVGAPVSILQASMESYDVTSDGRRIFMNGGQRTLDGTAKLTVVINWAADLPSKK